jgi:hypothetical protein
LRLRSRFWLVLLSSSLCSRLSRTAAAASADRRSDMTKLIAAIALTFVLVTGAAVVIAVQVQPAVAGCSGGNC